MTSESLPVSFVLFVVSVNISCRTSVEYFQRFAFDNCSFFCVCSGSILKKLLHTGNSFKVNAVFTSTRYEKSSHPATHFCSGLFCISFRILSSFSPYLLLCRSVVRGSVSSCCGCRPWGTTVQRSSSLSLPVWCQDSLLCPPPEGPVHLTPSFTTPSPTPLMVRQGRLTWICILLHVHISSQCHWFWDIFTA